MSKQQLDTDTTLWLLYNFCCHSCLTTPIHIFNSFEVCLFGSVLFEFLCLFTSYRDHQVDLIVVVVVVNDSGKIHAIEIDLINEVLSGDFYPY